MNKLKPLIVILGPTASGKTGLALKLAKQFNGELINADSRQIYKEMDIATNKICGVDTIKKDDTGEIVYYIDDVPIYLLDLISPNQNFSLAEYKMLATEKIRSVQEKGKLPILVGGTGLYISAVTDNLEIPEAPPDEKLRKEMEEIAAAELYAQLKEVDPESAKTIAPSNKRKIIRALEVYKTTGNKFSSLRKKGMPLFEIFEIGVNVRREDLYGKIDARVDAMVNSGLIDETEKLLEKYDPACPAMSGIGYGEITAHLKNECSLEEAIERIKFHTHQYARRQITWFKRDQKIKWVEGYEEAEKLISDFLI